MKTSSENAQKKLDLNFQTTKGSGVQGVFESEGVDGTETGIAHKAVKESVRPQISILILAIAPFSIPHTAI